MEIVNCSCNGFNPDCSKCDGKGYYDIDVKEIHINAVKNIYKTISDIKYEEKIKKLSINEIKNLISYLESEINFENSRIINSPKKKKRYTNSFRRNQLKRKLEIVNGYAKLTGIV